MELEKSADYFLVQFKECGDDGWRFEVWMQADGPSPATLMAYPSAFGAESHLENHKRAGREARLVSIRGPEALSIEGDQKFEIFGSCGFHQLKEVRQLLT
jgi:hypothetical protein